MIAMVAMLAFVTDAGRFFIVRREVQNIADAAALAAAQQFSSTPPPTRVTSTCAGEPTSHQRVVCSYVELNSALASSLCFNKIEFDKPIVPNAQVNLSGGGIGSPNLTVNVHCRADYIFGQMIGLKRQDIAAHATAVLGQWDINGQIIDYAGVQTRLTARLLPD